MLSRLPRAATTAIKRATATGATATHAAAATAPALQAARSFAAAPAAASSGPRFPGPITHNQHTPHMTAGVSQLTSVIAERAQGSYIYGKDGKKYLDFCTGIGVTNLGHCHPRVRHTAMHRQAELCNTPAMRVSHAQRVRRRVN